MDRDEMQEMLLARVRISAAMWRSLARSREKEEEEEQSLGLRLERLT